MRPVFEVSRYIIAFVKTNSYKSQFILHTMGKYVYQVVLWSGDDERTCFGTFTSLERAKNHQQKVMDRVIWKFNEQNLCSLKRYMKHHPDLSVEEAKKKSLYSENPRWITPDKDSILYKVNREDIFWFRRGKKEEGYEMCLWIEKHTKNKESDIDKKLDYIC